MLRYVHKAFSIKEKRCPKSGHLFYLEIKYLLCGLLGCVGKGEEEIFISTD